MDHLISTTLAASLVGYSRDTVVRWSRALGIEPVRVFGKRLLSPSEFEALQSYAKRRRSEAGIASRRAISTHEGSDHVA